VNCIRRQLLAAVVATAALAAPASGASAETVPPVSGGLSQTGVPVTGGVPIAGGTALGGNQTGAAGCSGGNRPSVGGNTGSSSHQTCATLLSFSGPQIGQIASVIGPTLIGSPLTTVAVTAGSVQY
jgi:hypothetical protein